MDTFLFITGAMLALGGALIAVAARHLFRAALGLSVALAGTAGLFVPLSGEFISVVQILVYLGAVAIAVVFILMLSPPFYLQRPKRNKWKVLAAALVALVFTSPLYITTLLWPQPSRGPSESVDTTAKIGHAFLKDYVFPFEIISIVLTIAIIGAIVIARDLPSDKRLERAAQARKLADDENNVEAAS